MKVKDALIGFSVGDALGVPIEFTHRNNDVNTYLKDMIGFGSHNVPAGTWSDDTSMTIATMDSLIQNNGISLEDIMEKFVQWLSMSKYTATDKVFDIGNTTYKALHKYETNRDIKTCGSNEEWENGNGSLMRMLPIALYLYYNNFSAEKEVDIINSVSALTHAHEISVLGCNIYCDFIKQLLKNKGDYKLSYDFIINKDYSKYYSEQTINKYSRVLNGSIIDLNVSDIKSSGYVIDTLEASLWCVLNNDSYENSVVQAINLGNDTDTIGAITGSMCGIIYGLENIPERWINSLKKINYLNELSEKFETVVLGKKLEFTDNYSDKVSPSISTNVSYYLLNDSIIFMIDNDSMLFYRLNENNEWVLSNDLVSVFHDSVYNYVKVDSSYVASFISQRSKKL